MNNSNRKLRLAALLVATAVAVFWSACGGPKVESTSIDGRVRQIDNWSIEWVGDSTITLDSVALRWLTEKRSKYTEPDFCLAYVSDVRNRLVSDHELPMYENLPMTGRIEVMIHGARQTLTSYTNTTEAARVTAELAEERPGTLADPFDREAMYRFTVDNVQRVDIQLYDREGKLLGDIFVGGEAGDKVKPKHVANAIASAIKGGRVKPAPGPE